MYIAYRKVIRHVSKLPNRTHNFILNSIFDSNEGRLHKTIHVLHNY